LAYAVHTAGRVYRILGYHCTASRVYAHNRRCTRPDAWLLIKTRLIPHYWPWYRLRFRGGAPLKCIVGPNNHQICSRRTDEFHRFTVTIRVNRVKLGQWSYQVSLQRHKAKAKHKANNLVISDRFNWRSKIAKNW